MPSDFIDLAQVFLLAMIVIGMTIKEAERNDQATFGGPSPILGFFILLISWVIITAVVLALAWGAWSAARWLLESYGGFG